MFSLTHISFYLFLIIGLAIYLKMPARYQWIWLLTLSIVFYSLSTFVLSFIYILITTFSVYLATSLMNGRNDRFRNITAGTVITLNISLLFLIKGISGQEGSSDTFLPVPLGLSFYTLQMISYVLQCKWQQIKPERNFFKLLLFCCYFPQIVSGPISRYSELGHQFFEEHRFSYRRITSGMIRIAWGLFEKRVIADRLALILEYIDGLRNEDAGFLLIITFLLYPLQLYTDFSGCIDIALGVSECFGITLPNNFRAPFLSKNTQELWHRFNITLGVFLRDNVMYPVQKAILMISPADNSGKRSWKRFSVYIATLATWLCMGIWHGWGLQYILGEGVWFWLVINIEHAFSGRRKVSSNKADLLKVIRTYLLYSFGMIFFYSSSLTDAFDKIANSVHPFHGINMNEFCKSISLGSYLHIAVLIIALSVLFAVDRRIYAGVDVRSSLRSQKRSVRWICYWGLVFMIFISLNLSTKVFVYAQF